MERYIIQPSDTPNHWVCTDQHNGIVCVFKQGLFNESQKFTELSEFTPQKITEYARILREMGDWLRENHYDKIF